MKFSRTKNLYLYLFGSSTSVFGDVMLTTALALHIMKLTASPKLFGSILAMAFIPRFILSIFAGALVDRLDKKKVMIFLDLIRGCVLLALLFVPTLNLSIIIPLILLFAVSDTFFIPAAISIVPLTFKKEHIGTVNSLDQSLRSTFNVLAPMISSFLFGTIGLKIILLIDAITFLLSALSEVYLVCDSPIKPAKKLSLFGDMVSGFKVITKDIRVTSLMINGALTHLFMFTFIEVGMISMLLVTFKAPDFHYGFLQGIISASAILASFIAMHQRHRRSLAKQINIGIIGMITAVIIFIPIGSKGVISWLSTGTYYPVIYLSLGCFCMFLSFGYYVVFFRTFYQSEVPREYLGRFASLFTMLVSLSRMLGMYVYGILFEEQKLIYPVLLLAVGMVIKLLVHIPFMKVDRIKHNT